VETRLLQLPDLGYEESGEMVKLAIVSLAFNNPDIIKLLIKRGSAIIAEDWDLQRKIED